MKLKDSNRIIEIRMCIWDGAQYSPDFSNDFFEAANLPYDEEADAYIVKDVNYCIEQAYNWQNSEADFAEDKPNENNKVFVEEL